jgi:integrase/recombinase XerD
LCINFYLLERVAQMAQAKTLTTNELRQVLDYTADHSFAMRNRMILLFSFWSGMRVGEIASLRVADVVDAGGKVKAEIKLAAEQTKGKHARTVFLSQKLRDELQVYCDIRAVKDRKQAFFLTAGGKPFSANVMTQHFFWLYRKAGVDGASSHSGRRTFITTLASKGIGVRVLASLAGHRSIAVTQCYIDVNDDMKRNAVELV